MPVVGKEKVTWMKLTTKPLDKEENFSKVKRALCSLAQVQDQLFDEKSKETVTIKVVCCSPEKVAEKLCHKGGGAIKKIEYGIENPMAPKAKAPEKPKEGDKPKDGDKPKEGDKPKNGDKPKEGDKPKDSDKPKPAPAPAASSSQTMIYNSEPGHPMYGGSYNGYYQEYGYYSEPQWGQPMHNGYVARSIPDSYGGGGWNGDESGSYCTIM